MSPADNGYVGGIGVHSPSDTSPTDHCTPAPLLQPLDHRVAGADRTHNAGFGRGRIHDRVAICLQRVGGLSLSSPDSVIR